MTTFEGRKEWDKRIICIHCGKKWSEHISTNEVTNECPAEKK